jgi:hypothetical protein
MTIALTTIKLYLHGPSATLACEIVLTKKLEKKKKIQLGGEQAYISHVLSKSIY